MKREFGKKLIEDYFPTIDLTHVLDTSGAHIPGHGTPTVILLWRSRRPVGEMVRAVLGIKGEPSTPDDPSQGCVWKSIVRHIDRAGAEDEYTSTAEVPRTTFASHPWSIGGGGAADLNVALSEAATENLGSLIETISAGICITREDEAYLIDRASLFRNRIEALYRIPSVQGSHVRDWSLLKFSDRHGFWGWGILLT